MIFDTELNTLIFTLYILLSVKIKVLYVKGKVILPFSQCS